MKLVLQGFGRTLRLRLKRTLPPLRGDTAVQAVKTAAVKLSAAV